MRGVSTMRLLFNLMTHTELSTIRVIPVLDHQSSKPLLSHNFSTPKARPKASSRDQHTQEQHRRTPRGKLFVTKSSNTGEINLCNFEGKQPKNSVLDLLSENRAQRIYAMPFISYEL